MIESMTAETEPDPQTDPDLDDLGMTPPAGKIDSEEVVLAGAAQRHDLLTKALIQLSDEHFVNPNYRLLFKIMRRYDEQAGETLSTRMLVLLLERSKWEQTLCIALETTYAQLRGFKLAPGEFRWALHDMREEHARIATGEVIAESMEILERGWSDPVKTQGKVLEGHGAAREYANSQLFAIDRARTSETVPEGDIRVERVKALEQYAKRESGEVTIGVLCGMKTIDNVTGGFSNGELIFPVAYTGAGKTQFVTQTAWHVMAGQAQDGGKGQNVFFATSETLRDQVMRRVWARHSRCKQFGMPGGINSEDIKRGTLSKEGKKVFADVLEDLEYNPAYGSLHIAQLPRDATVAYIESRLRNYGRQYDTALCVIDYLGLVKPAYRRQNRREEFDEIINDSKAMATDFMDGRGIPVLSPWSVNQEKYKEALTKRAYTLAALSETSVAEKTADTIIAMLREEDNKTEARLQFLKIRDGDLPPIRDIEIDFRSTYLGDRETIGFTAGALVGAGMSATSQAEGILGY